MIYFSCKISRMKKESVISIAITVITLLWIGVILARSGSTGPNPISSSGTTNTPASTSQGTILTATAVAAHNTQNDCWIILNGKAYDVTGYLNQHPGGSEAIIAYCGTDATHAFDSIKNGRGHSGQATQELPSLLVGTIQ